MRNAAAIILIVYFISGGNVAANEDVRKIFT